MHFVGNEDAEVPAYCGLESVAIAIGGEPRFHADTEARFDLDGLTRTLNDSQRQSQWINWC